LPDAGSPSRMGQGPARWLESLISSKVFLQRPTAGQRRWAFCSRRCIAVHPHRTTCTTKSKHLNRRLPLSMSIQVADSWAFIRTTPLRRPSSHHHAGYGLARASNVAPCSRFTARVAASTPPEKRPLKSLRREEAPENFGARRFRDLQEKVGDPCRMTNSPKASMNSFPISTRWFPRCADTRRARSTWPLKRGFTCWKPIAGS